MAFNSKHSTYKETIPDSLFIETEFLVFCRIRFWDSI